MCGPSGWDLLQARELKAALKVLQKEYQRHHAKGFLNNIGICNLMLGKAAEAKEAFDQALSFPTRDTATHALAGVARWFLNEREAAVELWRDGLTCEYRDYAGGMELPLLLYYASVRRPDVLTSTDAKGTIWDASCSRLSKNWPGALGRLLVGQMNEDQVEIEARSEIPEIEVQQFNQLVFYKGIISLKDGDTKSFTARMSECAAQGGCELNPEWHLACCECGKLTC